MFDVQKFIRGLEKTWEYAASDKFPEMGSVKMPEEEQKPRVYGGSGVRSPKELWQEQQNGGDDPDGVPYPGQYLRYRPHHYSHPGGENMAKKNQVSEALKEGKVVTSARFVVRGVGYVCGPFERVFEGRGAKTQATKFAKAARDAAKSKKYASTIKLFKAG